MRPPGYELPEGMALRLLKSLYGLKQSGKHWNVLLHTLLTSKEFSFKRFKEDSCLYCRVNKGNRAITMLCIYFDDLYIASNRRSSILTHFPKRLNNHYPLKAWEIPQQL